MRRKASDRTNARGILNAEEAMRTSVHPIRIDKEKRRACFYRRR